MEFINREFELDYLGRSYREEKSELIALFSRSGSRWASYGGGRGWYLPALPGEIAAAWTGGSFWG